MVNLVVSRLPALSIPRLGWVYPTNPVNPISEVLITS